MSTRPHPTVTIGVTARERFSLAEKCLRAIFAHTDVPFTLIFVDVGYPSRYLREVDAVLAGRSNVKIITTDGFVRPTAQKNLILDSTTDEYVCIIENDCIPEQGWLSAMIEAMERLDAGAATPLLLEGRARFREVVHHDLGTGGIESWEEGGATVRKFVTDDSIKRWKDLNGPKVVQSTEFHCNMYRRDALTAMGKFDEKIVTRQNCDATLMLHAAGVRLIVVPGARVVHYAPPPIYRDELPYYHFIWDLAEAEEGERYLMRKWNLRSMPTSIPFLKGQRFRTSELRWLAYRAARVAARAWKLVTSGVRYEVLDRSNPS